jgi:hypothetical protein
MLVSHALTAKQQMHTYKYTQMHIIIFYRNISVTLVTIIMGSSYNKNIINIKFVFKNGTIKPFDVTHVL